MTVTVQADDLGLYASSTDKMIETYKQGYLDRAAIVPNGAAFTLAAALLKQNTRLRWSVHLNIVEGRSLSGRQKIPLLVDDRGCFRRTFLTLWLLYVLFRRKRMELVKQIETELEAQIQRIKSGLSNKPIFVDSHQYLHLLPFVLRILLQRAVHWGIAGIRIVHEPFLLPPFTPQGLASLFTANIVKHIVLRLLTHRCLPALRRAGIAYPDYLVGVLFSGKMSLQVVRRVLRKIAASHSVPDPEVELVFHPCSTDSREVRKTNTGGRNNRFYISSDRVREMQILKSREFRRYLDRIRSVQDEAS